MAAIPVIDVRLAGPGDREVLAGLESVLRSREEPDFVDLLFETIDRGERSLVLGFMNQQAAGYAVVNWKPSYFLFQRLGIPELQDLNVLPEARRNGLGQAIVAYCEHVARQRGGAEMGLGVGLNQHYGAAQRLYMRMGYLPDGHGITYDRIPVKAGDVHPADDDLCLMMVKDLGAGR